jgi:hypothetical protein
MDLMRITPSGARPCEIAEAEIAQAAAYELLLQEDMDEVM